MDNKIKILIIDDDEIIRETYADVFRQEGFEVSEAEDGVAGLDRATKENPDIIFTGIIMPRMDGFGLKDALAKNVNTAKIPVMMLSHMGREEDRKKAQGVGVKDFIIKSMVTPKEVVERVRELFSERKKYQLKFDANELDAPELSKVLHLEKGLQCSKCLKEMILNLEVIDADKHEFRANLICAECEKRK